ncbi:glycosyltransferase family 4 protein [Planktomarina temperata]|nr:glycosyltransferase family 4 protein [Planktomarina temperata]
MKIALICKYASLPGEGLLTRIYYMADFLNQSGATVDLYISDSNHLKHGSIALEKTRLVRPGFNVHIVKSIGYSRGGKYSRLLSWLLFDLKVFIILLFKKKRDIYIASSPSLISGLVGILLKKIKSSKFIFDIRDFWPDVLVEEVYMNKNSVPLRVLYLMERLILRGSDMVTSSVPNIKLYLEHKNVEIDYLVWPICFDKNLTFIENKRIVESKPGKLHVGYAGSIGDTNNLDAFFTAVIQLKDDNRFHFSIVGSGSKLQQYKDLCKELENISFYDQIDKKFIAEFYKHIDLVYIATHDSSLWQYGQSLNKVVDAMYFAKPILFGYPSDGFDDMIKASRCGWQVSPNSPLEIVSQLMKLYEIRVQLPAVGSLGQDWLSINRNYSERYPQLSKTLMQSLE